MEYPKIETLYERDLQTFKVRSGVFKNRVYSLLKHWHFTEKIDGMNMRAMWSGGGDKVGFDDNQLSFAGRTDNAQIPGDLYKRVQELITPEKMAAVFPGVPVVLYGEGYGPGIQKGGGGYGPIKDFILFDVLVDGNTWWLNWEQVNDVAIKLGLAVVPDLGRMTLEVATEFVRTGFASRLNNGKRLAEGLVGQPDETLFDKKGHRLILKLKTNDFVKESQ